MNRFLSSKNTFTDSISLEFSACFVRNFVCYNDIGRAKCFIYFDCDINNFVCNLDFVIYKICNKSNNLLYGSGSFRERINIFKLKKIENFSGMIPPVTMNQALGNNGLILYHDKYESIFITPEKTNIFSEELLKINPEIEVSN